MLQRQINASNVMEVDDMARLMNVEEMAEHLRLTKRTIYRLLKKGNIPAVKVGHKWRFDKDAIDKWLQPETERVKLRILVVDDDPIIGLLFREALNTLGHTVVTANTSAEGLGYVERLSFDLIFLDLKMPEMDGAELLRRIKIIKPDVPVTIITGYPDSEIMVRAMEQGPLSVMKKPFGLSDIAAAVDYAMGVILSSRR